MEETKEHFKLDEKEGLSSEQVQKIEKLMGKMNYNRKRKKVYS